MTSYDIEVVRDQNRRHWKWEPSDPGITLKQARKRVKNYDAPTRIVRVTREVVKEVEIR